MCFVLTLVSHFPAGEKLVWCYCPYVGCRKDPNWMPHWVGSIVVVYQREGIRALCYSWETWDLGGVAVGNHVLCVF